MYNVFHLNGKKTYLLHDYQLEQENKIVNYYFCYTRLQSYSKPFGRLAWWLNNFVFEVNKPTGTSARPCRGYNKIRPSSSLNLGPCLVGGWKSFDERETML